jgi:twitching motility protein PilT
LLLPRKDKPGRILATETLIATDAVKINIRNDQLIQLPTIMQTGSAFKMQLMYDAVKKYWQEGIIDEQVFNFYCEGLTRHGR